MRYTKEEERLLSQVNQIGMQIDTLPDENLIFITLSPYLDKLMSLLKRLKPTEIQVLFIRYEGVMKVMGMIEDEAQKMEKELGIA